MKPAISYRLLFALLTAAVVLLLSCNPAKKVMDQQQQYERLINDYLVKHPQQIDTITEYIPGKPKLVPVPVPVIDTVVLRKVKDSLQKKLAAKYDDIQADCSRQVNEAFETGYNQARYEFSQRKDTVKTPDTIKLKLQLTTQLNALKATVNQLQQDNAKLTGQLQQAQKKQSFFWYLIASIFLNGVQLTLFFRRKIKAQ